MARRILDETTSSTLNSDDYLYVDGVTDGARKITADNVVRGTSVAQQLAQHIEDAEDEVEQITEDIEGIQSDITDLMGDIGDLSDLETEDKSSLVNAINEAAQSGGGSGLTEDVKQALLDCFENVAWINDDGQTYYDALEDALYPPVELVSISCVYTQTGTVYTTDTLDSLKPDLVVTAHMSDSTTQTVTTYTLSGTLTEGTSTITVTYGGKTATFNVTVSVLPMLYPLENGTHVFTGKNNRTVSVSNYNHIEYTDPSPTSASSGTGAYIDLRNVSQNNTTGTSSANYNRSDVWFTIPTGANYRMEVKNISSSHLVSSRNFAVFFNNEGTAKIHSGNISNNTGTTVTGTASSDIVITCLGAYISYDYAYLNFDIELYVNDVRWV